MAYGDFKDLSRSTGYDKILRDKAFNVDKNSKCDRYQRGIASMAYEFFDKRNSGSSSAVKNESMSNKKLAEILHKPIIIKFEKGKVYSSFIDNMLGADLADVQWIGKFNKRICFLLCIFDIFIKNAWVIPLKVRKGDTNVNASEEILDESNSTLKKIWIDKYSKFCSMFMARKKILQKRIQHITKENLLLLKELLETYYDTQF